MKKRNKKSQVSVQFHWIFIIIAGAVILTFFVGIVFKQKIVSEQKIAIAVVSDLEPIIAGAGVSEDTFNIVDIPKAEIEFICSGDYSEYSVKGTGIHNEIPTDVMFSPDLIKGKSLYIWTLNWQMPFSITNFIMLTSPNIRYEIIYGKDSYEWAYKITYEHLPGELNKGVLNNIDNLNTIENLGYDKTRFIFVGCEPAIPNDFKNQPDNKISALQISETEIKFYKKTGGHFSEEKGFPVAEPFTEKDPLLYSAIFSENSAMYECAMKKAFKRLKFVADILSARAEKLKEFYGSERTWCYSFYDIGIGYLADIEKPADFNTLHSNANNLFNLNNQLMQYDCILIY